MGADIVGSTCDVGRGDIVESERCQTSLIRCVKGASYHDAFIKGELWTVIPSISDGALAHSQ